MIRYCPNCHTERPLTDFFCGGEVDGVSCNWDLSSEGIHPEGWRPPRIVPDGPSSLLLHPTCRNGHSMEEGDLICLECGADAAAPLATSGHQDERAISAIDVWTIQNIIPTAGRSAERFTVRHETTEQEATLYLFKTGFEPEPLVYEALQKLPLAHVPQLFAWGRWENRFFTVAESFSGKNLADLGSVIADEAGVRHIVSELGEALDSLTEAGIRHRDLSPEILVVRTAEPLDLIITGFGSARLSDFDLDIVAPLETTPYMAPEAIAGAVSPASDWWSLGMILLEQLTGGEIFTGVHERAFIIQVLTNGVTIPDSLPSALQRLLKGLLARDHASRWQWREVKAWLEGQFVELPAEYTTTVFGVEQASAISLGGKTYTNPLQFALHAAEADHWEEARSLMCRGGLATWLSALIGASSENETLIRFTEKLSNMRPEGNTEMEQWRNDRQLMLLLKLLNPSMPLVLRGELLSPGWLLTYPREGYALIHSDVPKMLSECMPDDTNWLLRLQTRECEIGERARSLDIPLNKDALRIYCLNTSQSRLAAIWGERLKAFPETDHPGAALLLERQNLTDSDCIILLSAELSLFKSAHEILNEATLLARENKVLVFSPEQAERLVEKARDGLYQALDERLNDFAYCAHAALDQWAQEYRIKKRLPLAKILVILATPSDAWSTPPMQQYIQELLGHFDKKIAAAGMRGPLVRMQTGDRSSNIDFADLATERTPAVELVNHILGRTPRAVMLDPLIFEDAVHLMAGKLGRLQSKNNLYHRDTGINGLYVGFPFLVYRANQAMRNPRVMPLMLWPARMEGELYSRKIKLGFDLDREEVRLNPLLQAVVGPDAFKRWEEVARTLLSRSNLEIPEAINILSTAADAVEPELQRLVAQECRTPIGKQHVLVSAAKPVAFANGTKIPIGKQHLIASAVLFHATFAGQAISEELRLLAQTAAFPGAMGTAFGLYEAAPTSSNPLSGEQASYFVTHRDPSQEIAIQKSRFPEGLLIEGPPGTGKSQTIVNMVSQAMGDKRTVLIVCQKRAALEVVYKRLEAEGLSGRIIMLTDSARERTAIIREVRAQVENYFSLMIPSVQDKKREREELLLFIEKLEAEIDASHQALHHNDPKCGYSYRDILGKLISLHGPTAGIRVPQIQKMLEPLTMPDLTDLLEKCAPLTSLWLEARYENNPLHAFHRFTPDSDSIKMLQNILNEFLEVEKERIAHSENLSCALSRHNDAVFSAWYASHAPGIEALQQKDLTMVSRWFPLFKIPGQRVSVTAGDALGEELENIVRSFPECPLSEFSLTLSPITASLPHGRLAALYRDSAPDKPSYFQLCAPWRILGRRRLASLLKQAGMGRATPIAKSEVHGAAKLELAMRPLRDKQQMIHRKLGMEPVPNDEILQISSLALQTLQSFRSVGEILKSLLQLPEASLLEDALLLADRKAVTSELNQFKNAAERHAYTVRSLNLLDSLSQWLTKKSNEQLRHAVDKGNTALPFLESLLAAMPYIEPFMAFANRRTALSDEAMRLFSLMRQHEDVFFDIPPERRESFFRNIVQTEAFLVWKERLEIQHPLLGMERDELESKISRLKEADARLRNINRDILAWSVDLRKLGSRSRWVDITRLNGKRARRLREFVAEGAEIGLLALRPVWLMNPDTASRIFPLTPNFFDVVIYDEASQMPVEYAVPTLYRAKGAVVSGDEKQMPPSSFFSARVTDGDDELMLDHVEERIEERETKREIKDCSDMLQLARRILPQTTLRIHYRSAYRELINFSNAAFYENQLFVPANNPLTKVLREKPLRYIAVNGLYKEQTNREEAQAVVGLLEEIWNSPHGRPSVGVLTFNQKQASLIDDLIEEKILHDDMFRQNYASETARREGGEDMSFFVKNVENVQGDERDVIIFSSTFGRDGAGRFIRNFGALGHKGGERRLNVAITRARKQVILVSSMPIKDISDMLSTQRLPMVPRDYLQVYWAYAEALSRGEFHTAAEILERVTPRHTKNGSRAHAPVAGNSGIHSAVKTSLEQNGWKVTAGDENNIFGLSFLLEDEWSGTFFMGVECDGPQHNLLTKARSREIWRTDVLRCGIPHIYRVSSKAWFENPEREETRLLAAAKHASTENGAST